MIKEMDGRKNHRLRANPEGKLILSEKSAKRIKGRDALFDIWKDYPETRDVTAYIDSLRGSLRHPRATRPE